MGAFTNLRSIRSRSFRSGIAFGSMAICLAVGALPAYAQDAAQGADAAAAKDNKAVPEIVVTGTLIRGKAPTGSELVTISSADIASLGATDTSQLLSALPQDAEFNNRPQVGAYGQYQSVNAPLLRYLGGNSSGSNSTLLLLDGVRLPGMGITQTSADIDAIPPGAIARVDVATDGGSATYGADAVGGVVNLITRKRFDGLEVGGHYGGADDYRQWDISATAGKTWSNGSFWISYNYAQHNLVYNSARDYSQALDYTTTPYSPLNNQCSPGNLVAGGYVSIPNPPYYALVTQTYPVVNGAPSSSPGLGNRCDLSKYSTFFPGERRHSVMAALDVDLSDSINFNTKFYFTHRHAYNDGGPLPYAVPASYCTGGALCSNPAYAPYFTLSGTADGNMSPSFGNHSITSTDLDTWGITPKVTAKLGHDWQVVAFLNVGEGLAKFSGPSLDQTALANDVTNGTFNPFSAVFASTAAGQAAQAYEANYVGYSSGKDEITNGRIVLDGPLLSLPGGQVRAAIGGEILGENFTQRNGSAESNDLSSIAPNNASRTVKSAFGELSIPVVGDSNRMAGFYSLTLSAAGRYDHYSDFGGTFDPKLGLSWKPTSWWTLRGNWGKSFQAPSLAATASAIPVTLNTPFASEFGGNPNSSYPTAGTTILLLYPGGGVGLQAQKATTWEIGTDFKPEFFPGLSASLTYYNINFTNRIGQPTFYFTSFYTLYPNSYVMNSTTNPLTSAQIAQFVSSATTSSQTQNNAAYYIANPSKVYALENALSQNLASTKTSGMDFNISYQHPTRFGSVFGGVAGTYVLTFNSQATSVSPVQGFDANQVIHLRMATTLGAKFGDFMAKATWDFTGKFSVPATSANAYQTEVGSFSTINLAIQFTPKTTGALKNVIFNLNADNILNTNPPADNIAGAGGNGYFGFTLGRFIQLGINKKF